MRIQKWERTTPHNTSRDGTFDGLLSRWFDGSFDCYFDGSFDGSFDGQFGPRQDTDNPTQSLHAVTPKIHPFLHTTR